MDGGAWGGAIDLYVVAMRAAGRAAGTVRLHQHYLTQLRRAFPGSPWEVTTHQLRAVMANPGWGGDARKSARAVFRGFYRWGHGSGFVEDDPALGLESVTVPIKASNPTPEPVVLDLLRRHDERMVLMALLGACLGMRCGEISRVHAEDYDAFHDELLVHGKGKRERVLPIENDQLRYYLRRLDGWAFPNGQGTHLSPGYVSKLLSEAQPHRWTAHSLRHRAANVAHDGTGNIRAVQDMLGHSQVTTTQGYLRVTSTALREALRAAAGVSQERSA